MPLLDWLNKDEAIRQSTQVPYRLLKPVKKLSAGDPDNGNMLIQGDNLEHSQRLNIEQGRNVAQQIRDMISL